jgi:uncharacterized membrane protein YdfJ with MMPL/SSD domain
MATYLYRLGGWAFEHRWKTVALWLVVLFSVGAAAVAFKGKTDDKFSVPGTESQRADDLLHKKFPGAGGASARVVFVAPKGETLTDPENKAAVVESIDMAAKAPQVIKVVDPYSAGALNANRTIGFADVIYPVPKEDVEDDARDALEATAEPAEAAGLQVEFSGGLVVDETKSNEAGALIIAFVVLAIALVSLLAAALPLVTAILGVGIGLTGVTALTGVMTVSETAPILATMLGLAVGIDYALFILSRHHQNMDDGLEPREAAAQATATAGSAVVFAGMTVIIALLGLMVVNIPFLTVMGLAAETSLSVYVTGQTAVNIDTADRLAEKLPSYVIVVVGLALLLLMLVFRSILVPIKAAVGFLLSIAASMGLVVAVFQDGHMSGLFDVSRTGPIVSFLPILLIGILFGLAMDYEVFLISRVREKFVHTGKARESIVTGYRQSGRVVTAAAVIMISVFGSYVLDVDPVIKSIGLALASGVLIDAFVIRMTLVPAVMALMGRSAWWLPSWLNRAMPNVDIEGEGLLETLKHKRASHPAPAASSQVGTAEGVVR